MQNEWRFVGNPGLYSSCWSFQTAVSPVIDWCTDWFINNSRLSCNCAKLFAVIAEIKPRRFSNKVRMSGCIHGLMDMRPPCASTVQPPEGWIKEKSGCTQSGRLSKSQTTCVFAGKTDRYVQLEQKERREAWLQQTSRDTSARFNRRCLAKQIGVCESQYRNIAFQLKPYWLHNPVTEMQ